MLVFAASDKGGAGRSVTSSNVAYRAALRGDDVAYLDFDLGSPTAGAIFGIDRAETGTTGGAGLHRYLMRQVAAPDPIEVWQQAARQAIRHRPPGTGRLTLFPGDVGGGEFLTNTNLIDPCLDLFLRLNEQFGICFVDLSAGRSLAVELMLRVTALPQMRTITCRWLVFHRWTVQHVIAAGGLVHGPRGLLETARRYKHDPEHFTGNLRYVRTAVIDPSSLTHRGLSAEQGSWINDRNQRLNQLAGEYQVGRSRLLGSVPLDPMLQWQEQLVTDEDVVRGVANVATRNAFDDLARRLVDDAAWETL
ncbi:DNA-binding protein [Actinoplanes ianthinogenes]|uniref:DNA-binding protein n=1 Tax=Actinoplanes ianthinogenes TaxID=122358 RepID=A0ABN6CB00_9ACTN|nr:SCO2523 family variant P-loop protein [Actinoplanes ianthinogenes]BCJ42328.1 DNA-binding protein [Actinoplanes ianthinogenes]GGR57566.1 DNA-binding protein [Actinoplanes ianthinogenes]